MAPLSVASRGGGWRSVPSGPSAASSAERSARLAATPPPTSTLRHCFASTARSVFATSVSTTAAWNEAARSAVAPSSDPAASSSRTRFRTAVLSPLNETS